MHPILFHLGPITVRSYGVLIVAGFMIGLWRALRLCARRQQTEPPESPRRIHPDVIFDIGFFGLLIGLIGARLVFVLLDWSDFAGHPLEALKVWAGGLSLHGGMLFGILFLIWACLKWKKVSLLAAGDICAVSWALAYSVGRIGCLLNGCCYGGVCDLPWAVRFPDERHPGLLTPPSHPVQLYASLINLGFFFLLARWERRSRRDGELFWAYIGLYGLYRYAMEFFRAGATSTYVVPSLHLTDTHIISLVMMAFGVGGIFWLRRYRPAYRDGELPPVPVKPAELRHSVPGPSPS